MFSTAPNIDGGLAYGPGSVLFYTLFPTHRIGQIKLGSTSPDRFDNAPAALGSSLGTLAFVPSGFAGAGKVAIASFNSGQFCLASVSPDGVGTYSVSGCGTVVNIGGGPEGILYVPLGSLLFANPSILVSEYSAGRVVSYELDAGGLPLVGTRRNFITGLTGAEGATLDPLTGDFFFSTFGAINQVIRVSGFAAPTPTDAIPEPTTVSLFVIGAGWAILARKRR